MEKYLKFEWSPYFGTVAFSSLQELKKIFVKGPPFKLFIKKKMCFKIKIFVLNQ